MAFEFDILSPGDSSSPDHNRSRNIYNSNPDSLKQGLPDGRGMKEQVTGLGDSIWKQRGPDGGYQFMPVELGGVELWEPIIRAIGRKTVVQTPMIERRGSVKEIISIDDYVFNIRGVIKRQDGYWPDAELEQLVNLYERNEAIPIVSALTSRLLNGSEYVVLTNLDLPEKPGFVQSIEYSIECASDVPFFLELDENSELYGDL